MAHRIGSINRKGYSTYQRACRALALYLEGHPEEAGFPAHVEGRG